MKFVVILAIFVVSIGAIPVIVQNDDDGGHPLYLFGLIPVHKLKQTAVVGEEQADEPSPPLADQANRPPWGQNLWNQGGKPNNQPPTPPPSKNPPSFGPQWNPANWPGYQPKPPSSNDWSQNQPAPLNNQGQLGYPNQMPVPPPTYLG